jgi:hypothetical protein
MGSDAGDNTTFTGNPLDIGLIFHTISQPLRRYIRVHHCFVVCRIVLYHNRYQWQSENIVIAAPELFSVLSFGLSLITEQCHRRATPTNYPHALPMNPAVI